MSLLINNALLMGVHYNYPSEALYTFAEVDSMIINDGYIPVANADELNNLRNTVSQEMGLRTPWQGTYTTGTDKKYIQVLPLNMNNIRNFATIGGDVDYSFSGIFDGNELIIDNLYCATAGLFGIGNGTVQNVHVNLYSGYSAIGKLRYGTVDNCQSTVYAFSSGDEKGGLLRYMSAGIVTNCKTFGSVVANNFVGGMISKWDGGNISNCEANLSIESTGRYVGGFMSETGNHFGELETGKITNCIANGNILITSSSIVIGGFIGQFADGEIIECVSNGNVTGTINDSDTIDFGGFVGFMTNGTISKCFATGNVNAANRIGGFCSVQTGGTISDCYSTGNVNETNGTNSWNGSAGFISVNSGGTIVNCYSIGKVTGVNVTKGFCAMNNSTITNSYWDTITSEQSTSNGGTGKTTTEMQEGLIDDPDTDNIYVGWDDTIWDENTTNEYPTLK